MPYPTKEDIIQHLYRPTEEETEAVNAWKEQFYRKKWKKTPNSQKIVALKSLGDEILLARGIPDEEMPIYAAGKAPWGYMSEITVLQMDERSPSIISLLHELGHHIFGPSEFEACKYSIGIFKHCFPKEAEKLVWDGHLLRKRTQKTTVDIIS